MDDVRRAMGSDGCEVSYTSNGVGRITVEELSCLTDGTAHFLVLMTEVWFSDRLLGELQVEMWRQSRRPSCSGEDHHRHIV